MLPKALSKATEPLTLASSKLRIASDPPVRKLIVSASSSVGLGYVKQVARYGKAGGRWAVPVGKFIEKGIHVVSVLDSGLVPPSRARCYFVIAAGLQAHGAIQDMRDYAERISELHALVTKTFNDEREM